MMTKPIIFTSTIISLLCASASAVADGWRCRGSNLSIQVYDHKDPSIGTRTAAKMIIADPTAKFGSRTLAIFDDGAGTLLSRGSKYYANVDLRRNDIVGMNGRNFGGTKLGFVDRITLDVYFNFSNPLRNGEDAAGSVTIIRRRGMGGPLNVPVTCTRHLAKR